MQPYCEFKTCRFDGVHMHTIESIERYKEAEKKKRPQKTYDIPDYQMSVLIASMLWTGWLVARGQTLVLIGSCTLFVLCALYRAWKDDENERNS